MTVIACDLRVMAADTLCHEDDASHYHAAKLMRLPDGSIIGGAGNHPEVLMDWLFRGGDRPELKSKYDFSVLHLTRDGILLYVNSIVPNKLREKNYAIGCGSDLALYAMRVLKMPPEQACKEAIKINMFCGGDVEVMAL